MGGVALARHDLSIDVRDGVATTTIDEVFEKHDRRDPRGPVLVSRATRRERHGPHAVGRRPAGRRGDGRARARGADLQGHRRRHRAASRSGLARVGDGLRALAQDLPDRAARDANRARPPRAASGRARWARRDPLPARVGWTRHRGRPAERSGPPRRGRDQRGVAGLRGEDRERRELYGRDVRSLGFAPTGDFIVRYRTSESSGARLVVEPSLPCLDAPCAPMIDGAGVLTVWLEPGAVAPSAGTVEPNRVIVLDTSASQTEASLRTGRALAERLLDGMSEDQRFALIACDSACESFPSTGLVTAAEVDVARAPRVAASSRRARLERRRRRARGGARAPGWPTAGAARLRRRRRRQRWADPGGRDRGARDACARQVARRRSSGRHGAEHRRAEPARDRRGARGDRGSARAWRAPRARRDRRGARSAGAPRPEGDAARGDGARDRPRRQPRGSATSSSCSCSVEARAR
jgi:hypothetical protein